MNCHNCEVSLDWDGFSPIVVCEACLSYRFVDTPDVSANRIVTLNRPGNSHCPHCRNRTSEAAMDGVKVDHCAKCQGVLLSDDVFEMFVRNRGAEFREAATQATILVDEQQLAEIRCPYCRKRMDVHPCYGPNFIIIDTCVDCGVIWLDCAEIEVVEQPLEVESSIKPSKAEIRALHLAE